MHKSDIISDLITTSTPLMSGYQSDLHIDGDIIRGHRDGTRFLHFTRENGTHLVMFEQAVDLPAPHRMVSYIFGKIPVREYIGKKLKEVDSILDTFSRQMKLIRYFDGEKFTTVSPEEATKLAEEYVVTTLYAYNALHPGSVD